MIRTALAVLPLVLAATPAFADEPEVCILTSTETRTAPKKPNIFETQLDCGAEPTESQTYLAGVVNNAMNTADALTAVVEQGFEVETASWRDSYTGREIIGIFTLVKEGEVELANAAMLDSDDEPVEDATDETPDGDLAPEELPEAEETPLSDEEEELLDYEDDPDAEELDL